MPISDHQTTSVGLKRAGDPDSLNRVAGLELGLRAANGAWPILTCRGGVQKYTPTRLLSVADGIGWEPESFRTIAASDLGAVVVPSGSNGTPTETSTWDHITLAYTDLSATLSRATPAMLLEWSATSLRLLSGTVAKKRTTSGGVITETATQAILPKYVAYHTSGGYQVGTISTTPIDLSGMDQPWIMVWFGDQSHWVDATRNMFYGVNSGHPGQRGHPESDAFQADCPLLIVFSSNPTQIVRDGTAASGFDLTFSSGAKKASILPLYGRERLLAADTDGWTTGADLPQSKIAAVYPTLGYFPASVAETYAYDSGTDTATITESVSWTTVLASGGSKFCPLPVVLGNARDTDLPITLSDAVTDLDIPTEYGPTQGIVGVDSYDWSISGLAAYTVARPAPGSGSVPSRLQDDFDAEVDKLVSEDHWEPWIFGTRLPNGNIGGDLYYKNQADVLAQASELLPVTSGARRTALLDWLAAEQAAYPAESSYNVSATDGAERGPAGVPGTHASVHSGNPWYAYAYQSRQTLWAAWALARYHQESGISIPAGLVDDLLDILDLDMAEQDWATMHWLAGHGNRQFAVENASRHLAGLIGLAWLCEQEGHADEGEVRALLAKAVVTRVAMAHLPRWQYAQGLLTYPSDPAWTLERVSFWQGAIFTTDWVDAMDDPCVPVKFDQYHTYLADSSEVGFGWLSGGAGVGKAPAYRGFVKPAADILAQAVPGEGEIYAAKTRELIPYWWLPFREANLAREASLAQPMDTYGLYLAKAYLESPTAADLDREAAYPWLENGGDLMTLHKMAEAVRAYAGAGGATDISDSGTVTKRATFTVTFQSPSAATNTYPQYHATHNPDGQSHDVEFSDDSFATIITRPAFFETVFDHLAFGTDWYEPSGVTQWRANFAPPRSGSWQYRIRTTDASGEVVSATQDFTVTTSSHKGRVRASSADTRYFEYEDGSLFLPRGYNQPYHLMPFSAPDLQGATWAAGHADAGVNLVRIWLTHWAGTSTEGTTWTNTRFDTDRNIYVNPDGQPLLTPYGDHQMAAYVTAGYSTIAWDWNKQSVNVRPDTTYRVRLRYQIPFDMTTAGGGSYGLTFKTSDVWIINYDTEPTEPGKGTAHITPEHATTGDGTAWAEISGTLTTGASQYFLDQAFIVLENCSDGIAFIDHVWIEEDLGGGEYGPNLVGAPSFGAPSHNVNGEWMRRFSDFFAHIEATDLKLVLTTNPRATDWYLGVMGDDGELVSGGVDDNQWAGPDDGKQRYFHQSWAREVMARFGHSPSLFSMEFVNEGTAGNARTNAAAEDYCSYLKSLGDAPLVSTSHSGHLPRAAWDAMPSADYTDIHAYQTGSGDTGNNADVTVYDTDNTRVHAAADWLDSAAWIARVNDTCGVQNSTLADVRPVLLGEGAMSSTLDGGAPELIAQSSDVAATYWRKRLWVGKVHPGGVADIGEWLPDTTLYPSFDHRDLFGAVGGVVETVPLNEGGYVDIDATCPTGLRAFGQKKTSTGSAVIFIDNDEDTFGNLIDEVTPTPRTGDVTFSIPAGDYTVTPVDTSDGSLGSPSTLTSDGTLTLPITSLSTDVAYLIAGPGSGSFDGPGSIITMGLATDHLITQGYGEVAVAVTGNVITGGLGTDFLITQGYGETTPIAGNVITLGLGTDLLITQGYSSTSSEPTTWTGTGSAAAAATASATGFMQAFGTGAASASASASGTGTVQAFGTGTATARATASGVGTGGTALSRPQNRGRFPLLARFRLRF